jgi:hypothetical protein
MHGKAWSRIVLEDVHSNWRTTLDPGVDDEWPYLPGFTQMYVDDAQTLHVCFLDQPKLQQIAREYHYIILGGIGLEGFQQLETTPLTQALVGQLEALAGGRARLHLELSGAALPDGRLMPFARGIRDSIHSVGINDEELASITQLSDFPHDQQVPPAAAGSLYRRYLHARALAQALHLDRLYVHGNDADLILQKNATPGVMRQEITVDLFAKGLVVLAILKRSFKADWVEKACELDRTELTLAKKEFQALLRFTLDLYTHASWSIEELEAFARNGYFCDRSPGAYSLAVVPVMWPGLMENIISTGAGDICSGITVVYAGY